MPFAYIRYLSLDRWGRPVDPDYGIDVGPGSPGSPEHPWVPGYPGRPGQGLPPSWPGFPERPGHGLPPSWGGVDPGWGLPEGGRPGQGPIIPPGWPPFVPEEPGKPGQLPMLPPGTIWPPLPPEWELPKGKAMLMCWVPGLGMRYIVVDIPERPDLPERPGQGLPGARPEPKR